MIAKSKEQIEDTRLVLSLRWCDDIIADVVEWGLM